MAFRNYLPSRQNENRDLLSPSRLFDRMLENFFSDIGPTSLGSGQGISSFSPQIDVKENEREVLVTAELPGMKEEDVEITLTDNGLLLRGEKREEKKSEEKGQRHYVERTYGMFERLIPLRQEIDESKIEANFDRGILNIKMPKNAQSKSSRRIQISSAGRIEQERQEDQGRKSENRGKSGSSSSNQGGNEQHASSNA